MFYPVNIFGKMFYLVLFLVLYFFSIFGDRFSEILLLHYGVIDHCLIDLARLASDLFFGGLSLLVFIELLYKFNNIKR